MNNEVESQRKPLHTLRAMILEKYGRIYLAAGALRIPVNDLSCYMSGRLILSEKYILALENALGVDRSKFGKSLLE